MSRYIIFNHRECVSLCDLIPFSNVGSCLLPVISLGIKCVCPWLQLFSLRLFPESRLENLAQSIMKSCCYTDGKGGLCLNFQGCSLCRNISQWLGVKAQAYLREENINRGLGKYKPSLGQLREHSYGLGPQCQAQQLLTMFDLQTQTHKIMHRGPCHLKLL